MLARCERVATIDVGWTGAAAPQASIVDLAGVTDPEVAALPGGHTSKNISGAFLTARSPDALVFQLAPGADADTAPRFARNTEQRLASDPLVIRHYLVTWTSPPGSPVRYAVFTRREFTNDTH